jgi:hypothetical protein
MTVGIGELGEDAVGLIEGDQHRKLNNSRLPEN